MIHPLQRYKNIMEKVAAPINFLWEFYVLVWWEWSQYILPTLKMSFWFGPIWGWKDTRARKKIWKRERAVFLNAQRVINQQRWEELLKELEQ